MKDIKIFNSRQFGDIRTAGTSDEPLFCAADVCRALGYKNNRKAVADHCDKRDVTKRDTPTKNQFGRTVIQSVSFVNESGLYALIFGSKLETARQFKHWITSEVLPAIRKTGGYMVVSEQDSDAEIMARALLIAKDTITRRDQRIAELEAINRDQEDQLENNMLRIEVLNNQASYFQRILQCYGNLDVCQIAQDYGMSAVKFNKILRDLKVQYKQNQQWILYAPYKDKGYVHSRTIELENGYAVMQTQWTQKGRKFLYNILKRRGIMPLIEQQQQ